MHALTVTEYYGQDHQRLDELLRRFEHLKDADLSLAGCLFAEFKAGLERHIGWEEQILFPLFEAKTGMRDDGPTEVMRWEHRQILGLLAEIQARVAQRQAAPGPAVVALEDLLRQHNQKEEQILYPVTDELLSMSEREEVFAAMQRL